MLIAKLLRVIGLRSRKAGLPTVKFHHEANFFGEHGRIVVTNRRLGLLEEEVRFVFPGMSVPPALTPFMIQHLWDEAGDQGFVVHYLREYGKGLEAGKYALTTEVKTLDEIAHPNIIDAAGELPTDVAIHPFRGNRRSPAAVQDAVKAIAQGGA